MKPIYNCPDRQMAAAGVIAAAAIKIGAALKPMLPGATSAAGNAFARQKELEWSAPECGKRPFFIGKRRNEWEQCAALKAEQKGTYDFDKPKDTDKPSVLNFIKENKTPLIIGGVVLVGGAIFLLRKKRKK